MQLSIKALTKGMHILVACLELGFILLKTLPKAINMYMELEGVLGVQFTRTDLVTFVTGKKSVVLIFFKSQLRTGYIFEKFEG